MSGVFMYRKGEAKLFASPEDVPAGEGWQDTPVPAGAEPEADEPEGIASSEPVAVARRRGRPPKAETTE